MKHLKKKLNRNYSKMLYAIFNKSLKQHPTKQQLYSHLLLISQTIQVRWAICTWHYWKSKDKLRSDVLFWTPTQGQTSVGWPAKTYIHQPSVDTEYHLEDFWGCPGGVMVKAMNCGIVVREFVLQSRYYVHFRANTLGKGMNPLILPPAMGE